MKVGFFIIRLRNWFVWQWRFRKFKEIVPWGVSLIDPFPSPPTPEIIKYAKTLEGEARKWLAKNEIPSQS